mgnify:CR=1 FL=1|tara:strand:+ start:201 stop:488 length:288 start_codon:yes stop_codon:yes gene_type:complete
MAEKRYKNVNGEVVELTADEIKELDDRAAARDLDFSTIRAERNAYLNGCDWTQGADSPLTDEKKAEWAVYRQELRDFPASASKVSELGLFPTPPE